MCCIGALMSRVKGKNSDDAPTLKVALSEPLSYGSTRFIARQLADTVFLNSRVVIRSDGRAYGTHTSEGTLHLGANDSARLEDSSQSCFIEANHSRDALKEWPP